jgi:hypothetical protein
MPAWSQIAYLALLWAVWGLACAGVTQLAKVPLKILWKQQAGQTRLKGNALALYNWSIRAIPIVVGALGGLLPDVWPSWVAPTWAVTLGGTAGLMSVALYHGVKVTLPKLFAVLPEAFKKRLGGD